MRWTYSQGSNGYADTENRLVDTVGEREGGTNWESSMETYIYVCVCVCVCKIDSQWEFAVWCRQLKSGALWQTGRVGWGGKWEGGVRERGHMYTYGWFMLMYGRPTQYCKAIILQLKICVNVKSLSCVRLFVTPWTVAHQAPPSMEFSRQEYWSGHLIKNKLIQKKKMPIDVSEGCSLNIINQEVEKWGSCLFSIKQTELSGSLLEPEYC